MLDKLKDSIRFQANPGSESKSQNTWKVWLLSSSTVYDRCQNCRLWNKTHGSNMRLNVFHIFPLNALSSYAHVLDICRGFKEKANTWKRSLLDKLNDSIRFQANPGSESKSQNTWKVWLLSLLTVYNPEAVDPAPLKSWQLLFCWISQCFPKNGTGQEQLYRTLVGWQISVQVPLLRHGLFLQQPLVHVKSSAQGTMLVGT